MISMTAMRHYAQAAAQDAGLEAVILFGSRARGLADDASDWDLCVVGGRCEQTALAALRKHIPESVEKAGVDTLWTPSTVALTEQASAGTVWAHIVTDGTLLAGRTTMLQEIDIMPMEPETIRHRISVMLTKLDQTMRALYEPKHESAREREMRMMAGTEASVHAAEALTWLLAGFSGVDQDDRRHRSMRYANKVQDKAGEAEKNSDVQITLTALARQIERTNGHSRGGRRVLYDHTEIEDQPVWQERTIEILRGTQDLMDGCLTEQGPLRGLARYARKAGLIPTLTAESNVIARHANRWCDDAEAQRRGKAWPKIVRFGKRMHEIASHGEKTSQAHHQQFRRSD